MYDLITHCARQIVFSRATFGPSERREGVLDHMAKEMEEVRSGDGDPDEWIDLVILSFDGLWRSISAKSPNKRANQIAVEVVERLVRKQEKNEFRDWPNWRDVPEDKAIEHDRSDEPGPKPVAPDVEQEHYGNAPPPEEMEWRERMENLNAEMQRVGDRRYNIAVVTIGVAILLGVGLWVFG